ncbi:hypothetical protein FT638_11505 [Bacillus cereus]|nr:hypothetical protein [Bacillus cereus]
MFTIFLFLKKFSDKLLSFYIYNWITQKFLMVRIYRMKIRNIDYLEKLLYKNVYIQVIQIEEMDFYSELLKFNKSKRFIKNKI